MKSGIVTENALFQDYHYLKFLSGPTTGLLSRPSISSLLSMKVFGFSLIVNAGLKARTMAADLRSTHPKTDFFSRKLSSNCSISTLSPLTQMMVTR